VRIVSRVEDGSAELRVIYSGTRRLAVLVCSSLSLGTGWIRGDIYVVVDIGSPSGCNLYPIITIRRSGRHKRPMFVYLLIVSITFNSFLAKKWGV